MASSNNVCNKCSKLDCKCIMSLISIEENPEKCFYCDYLTTHPIYFDCIEEECLICSVRDCPYKEPLHYQFQGCPVCYGY